jgi:hypothetical protein
VKFVCVDLDTHQFSVLTTGSSPPEHEILFARENGNHFIPLRPTDARQEPPHPWNVNVAAARAAERRKQEEALRVAEALKKAKEKQARVEEMERLRLAAEKEKQARPEELKQEKIKAEEEEARKDIPAGLPPNFGSPLSGAASADDQTDSAHRLPPPPTPAGAFDFGGPLSGAESEEDQDTARNAGGTSEPSRKIGPSGIDFGGALSGDESELEVGGGDPCPTDTLGQGGGCGGGLRADSTGTAGRNSALPKMDGLTEAEVA